MATGRVLPRALRPAEFVELLNSAPIGDVVNQPALCRHRAWVGLRLGDREGIPLLPPAASPIIECRIRKRRDITLF